MSILNYRNMELSIGENNTLTVSKDVQNHISLIKFGDIYVLCSYDFSGEFSLYNGGIKSYGHFVTILEINAHKYIMDYRTKKFLCSERNGSIGTRDTPSAWEEFIFSENVVTKKIAINNDNYIFDEKDIFEIINGNSKFCTNLSELEINIIVSAILCSMPKEHLENFCKTLIHSRENIESIKNLFEHNHIIYKKLIELFNWKTNTRSASNYKGVDKVYGKLNELFNRSISKESTPNYRVIGQDLDWIVKYSKYQPEMSITEYLLHFARKSISPSKSSCVVTTARNEGIYLIEWIAHYLSLGFESIFIYSNDNSDGSDDLLYCLQKKGIIKLIKNEVSAGSDAQSKAYSDALMFNNDVLDHEWCLFVDMDEFIMLNADKFKDIKSFTKWHEQKDVDAICINWTYVASGENVSWFDAPLYQRFQDIEVAPNPLIKSMCKPRNFIGSQAHFPRSVESASPVFRNANGQLHTYNKSDAHPRTATAVSDFPSADFAVIYHYFHKSFEEFLWKFSRNRGDHPMKYEDISISLEERFLSGFISQFKENKDGKYTKRILKDNKFIKKILSDPEINRLNNSVIDAYIKRIKLVIQKFEQYTPSDNNKDFFLENISILKNKYKI